jgi:hypothetical protein
VRPALEVLEERRTPSVFGAVSSVDIAGNSETFDVHTDGTLWGNVNGSQFLQVRGESNVRSVSAGLDTQGLANVFVVHNDGSLTLQNTQSLASGSPGTLLANNVKSVVAEGNGKALVIDNQNFLWQFDPNGGWDMPVDSNGNPEFQGQPSQPLAANFGLLDANVKQATPLKAQALFGSLNTIVALHTDGTLTSDTLQRINLPGGQTGNNMLDPAILTPNLTSVAGIVSISSVTMPGSPYAKYLYTVSSNGDLQQTELSFGDVLKTDADYGNAGGAGFKDVNVGWNSGNSNSASAPVPPPHWVATTKTNQSYRDGQLMDGAVASAFMGPGGSFYEVYTNGAMVQWSPQAHTAWVEFYHRPTLQHPFGYWYWVQVLSNWTSLDGNVSQT